MKKIVSGKELQEKLEEAVNLLCNTVKSTLGPKGSNVIIDHSSFSPFITNDGVTIAENIESEDPVINTILELAKEASIKTNENVGDGTTTTLVLLQSLFNNGLKLIKDGVNPIILKRELDNSLNNIVNLIKDKSRIIKESEIINLLSISANDKNIGKILSDAFLKIDNPYAITIKEGSDIETTVEYLKGYTFDTNIASSYYFLNNKEFNITESKILLLNYELNNIEDIENIINNLIESNKSMIIIAKDYDDYLVKSIIELNMELDIKIILLKYIYYGKEEKYFYDDLKDITGSKIINSRENININCLGNIKNIHINKGITTIEFENNNIIVKKIKELEKSSGEEKRLSMLKNGIINIIVGAPTITERREKKMRFDDALCALKTLNEGILPGSGLMLFKVSNELKIDNVGDFLLKDALIAPFNEIMNNAGLDKEKIANEIKNNNYEIVYNVNKNMYEKIYNTEVIDSTKVVLNSLTNAVSIAGMLLTTNSLIINEYQNNLNKVNDYNEL